MGYADFKSYIQDKYCDILTTTIQEFVEKHHDGIGFHEYNVLSIVKQKVENIEIKSLLCYEEGIGELIRMEVGVSADVVEMCLGTKDSEASRKSRWFILHITAELHNGLHDFQVHRTEEYYNSKFATEHALDAYLIPYISTNDLEDIADEFFERYCLDAFYDQYQLPYGHIMSQMGIQVVESSLPDNVFGRMYFKPATIKYWQAYYPFPKVEVEKEVPAGTMVINKDHYFMGTFGSALNTIAHELVHWDLHKKFFEILALLDENVNQLSCEVVPQVPDENISGIQDAIWWAEWQANNLAPRIVMPRQLFLDVLSQCYDENTTPVHYRGELLESALEKTAKLFGVSKYDAKVRAIQLGIMEAEGTMLYFEKQFIYPISFRRTALSKNQTFAIDEKSYKRLLETDTEFATLIRQGLFIYAECFVVQNDPLYVEMSKHPHIEGAWVLTHYARENADECCMVFERRFRSDGSYNFEYYGQCFLSKELTDSILVETKRTDDLRNQNVEDRAKVSAKLKAEGSSLMKIMRNLPSSFSGTFNAHMERVKKDNGKKMTNIQMSIETGLSEDYIAKLRKDEVQNLSIGTVCALCMALHLPPCFSKDMIAKSRTGFPYNEDGYYQERLLEEMYMEPLAEVNEVLREANISPWGKV